MSHKFWFVWNAQGHGMPKHRHESKTSAKAEAKRLSETNPGQEFVVLESIGHYKTREPVQWTKHENANAVSFEYSLSESDSHE